MYIMESQKVINIVILDRFDTVGTIITTLVTVYCLYIIKFIDIFAGKGEKPSTKVITMSLK